MKQGRSMPEELKYFKDLVAGSIYVFGALGVMYVQRAYEEGERFNLVIGAFHFLWAGIGIMFYTTYLSENNPVNIELAGTSQDMLNYSDSEWL